jgi:hypothetical protein
MRDKRQSRQDNPNFIQVTAASRGRTDISRRANIFSAFLRAVRVRSSEVGSEKVEVKVRTCSRHGE